MADRPGHVGRIAWGLCVIGIAFSPLLMAARVSPLDAIVAAALAIVLWHAVAGDRWRLAARGAILAALAIEAMLRAGVIPAAAAMLLAASVGFGCAPDRPSRPSRLMDLCVYAPALLIAATLLPVPCAYVGSARAILALVLSIA